MRKFLISPFLSWIMFVKNKSELLDLGRNDSEKEMLEHILNLIEFILDTAQPQHIFSSSVCIENEKITIEDDTFSLEEYERFYLIAFGKASQNMAKWLIEHFPHNFERIVIVSPDNLDEFFKTVTPLSYFQGGHPKPNEQSVKAANEVISTLKQATNRDLCFFLISGGGSALLEASNNAVSFSDYEKLVELLLSSRASIQEINTLRKHLSKIKGGKLAQQTNAKIISFIISDVIGNDVSSIASGPTAPDETTWHDCKEILSKYSLISSVPESILSLLSKAVDSEIPETPNNSYLFSHVHNYIIGDNTKLLNQVQDYLNSCGESEPLNYHIIGEAKEIGKELAKQITLKVKDFMNKGLNKKTIISWVFGGETTVDLVNHEGKGGRNQELALSFALSILENESIYLLSLGTDGMDGNSDAAGAIIGPFTLDSNEKFEKAKKSLDANDSNRFFKENGGELITGYTGTNLMDVGIIFCSFKR